MGRKYQEKAASGKLRTVDMEEVCGTKTKVRKKGSSIRIRG